jgi:hypothetical protein
MNYELAKELAGAGFPQADKSLAAELAKKFGRLSVQNATKLGLSSGSRAKPETR